MRQQARGATTHTALRTHDPHEAEAAVAESYLRHRLDPLEAGDLDVHVDVLDAGPVTVGRLSYGVDASMHTDESTQYQVHIPLRGRAASRSGYEEPESTSSGQASLIPPEQPADILWMRGSTQLILMVPRSTLESEVEQLIGRALGRPITFERMMDLTAPGARGWRETLAVFVTELDDRPGLARREDIARHQERVVVDGLLVGHEHNYRDEITEGRYFPAARAIRRMVDLLADEPTNTWSTTGLEREAHLGVRSLQDGFRQQVGAPPMTYLRQVRLRRANRQLRDSEPGTTSVAGVASGLGFADVGHFATMYRRMFGEQPAATLRRE